MAVGCFEKLGKMQRHVSSFIDWCIDLYIDRQDEYHDASVHLWIFPPLYMHYVLLYFQYNYLKYGLVLPINNLLLGLYQFTALILKLPDSNISLHMQCKGFTTKATAGIFDIFQSERKRIGL